MKNNNTALEEQTFTPEELKEKGFVLDEYGNITGMNGNIYSRYILERFALMISEGERFYQYENGVWSFLDKLPLSRILRDFLHEHQQDIWTSSMENIYLSTLKREVPFAQVTDQQKNYINLLNGMFNLDTFELCAHDPDFYSTIQIPVNYDPDADCPMFKNFLDEVFEGDEERVMLVQEMMGYCLTAETRAQKAFILYGTGANGKSVLAEVLVKLCSRENVSSVSLKELENSFARYELVGKTLNLSTENEVDEGGLKTQYFKSIVSGDPIRVEVKHSLGFTYHPVCKLVFALNNLPYSRDSSHGFQRRLVIIPFNREFRETEADKSLADKLLTELAGILNFSLEGLKRLHEQEYCFTSSEEVKKALQEYKEDINPMAAFVAESIRPMRDSRFSNKDIVTYFKAWCHARGHRKLAEMTSKRFWKAFKQALNEQRIWFEHEKSNGVDYLVGISFKNLTDEPGLRSPLRERTVNPERKRPGYRPKASPRPFNPRRIPKVLPEPLITTLEDEPVLNPLEEADEELNEHLVALQEVFEKEEEEYEIRIEYAYLRTLFELGKTWSLADFQAYMVDHNWSHRLIRPKVVSKGGCLYISPRAH